MSTRALTAADYTRVVHTTRVTVHTTADGSTSIHLNMIKAGSADTMGTYQTSHCNYRDSNSSLHNFDIQAAPGLTVQHVLSLIEQKGRHEYRLARSGVGCRFWVQTIINDLDGSGFIASSSPVNAAAVVDGLRYNYSRSKSPEFEEVDPGTFV